MTIGIKKIYPSSSAFVQNGQVITEYNSGCLRYLLIASKSTKKPNIDPIFAEVGAFHEDWYAEYLGDSLQDREVVLKAQVLPGVEYSGRFDFLTRDGLIHETKATLSKNGYYSIINKGEWKLSHLAQLVSYLIETKKTEGKIAVGYYEKDSEESEDYIQVGKRVFQVTIEDKGEIFVDGRDTGYTVLEQLAHRYAVANTLTDDSIADRRPISPNSYGNPCSFCPLATICDEYDNGRVDKDTYVHNSIKAIESSEPMKAKVNIPKRRRRVNGR